MGARRRISPSPALRPRVGCRPSARTWRQRDLHTVEWPRRRRRRPSPSRSCRRSPRRSAGRSSGAWLPPRRTQVKTEGSSRRSAVATSETWVDPSRTARAASTVSASNPGMTTSGVPVTIERVTTDEPTDVRQRQAGEPRVPAGSMSSRVRGRPGRGRHRVVGEHDTLGLTRRARGRDDERVAVLDRRCRRAARAARRPSPTIRVGRRASSSARSRRRRQAWVEGSRGVAGVPDGSERVDEAACHQEGRVRRAQAPASSVGRRADRGHRKSS